MDESNKKFCWVFLVFAGVCALTLPFVVLSIHTETPGASEAEAVEIVESRPRDLDWNAEDFYEDFDKLSRVYLEGTSSQRTLEEFYSRRQYAGSPPFIPHKVEEADGTRLECLTCHARGGWTEELKRNTPVTPHPENTSCRQCHVGLAVDALFVENDWFSLPPPRLGRSHLPGSPPPIAHNLQMRGNCIACHVGPGAVASIRVDHPSRGSCRQCHVPDALPGVFERESDY